MAIRRVQRAIRLSNDERAAVVESAEKDGVTPGSFVRKAVAHAAADARVAQNKTLGADEPNAATPGAPPGASAGVAYA